MVAVKQVRKPPGQARPAVMLLPFYCSKTTINDVAPVGPKSPGPTGVLPVTVRLVLTVTNMEHFLWATYGPEHFNGST